MPSTADPVKLGQLMEDLYTKKKWLDRVIASLESAIDSPDFRLIAAVTEAFERAEKGAEKINIQQFQHGTPAGPQLNGISRHQPDQNNRVKMRRAQPKREAPLRAAPRPAV